jgi:DNA-directed RNA polymerase specialized sigma24 family protein
MKRTAQLIRTAREVRRRIWASLPFGERFAQVVSKLASSGTDAFGTAMYGLFAENGIEGLPPINGKPASEWLANHPVGRLPAAYGREFGRKAFLSLMRKFHNPTTVEDLMSQFMVRFMERAGQYLKPGTSLREAEAYVMRSLYNEGINVIRRKRHEIGESTLDRNDEEEGPGFLSRAPAPEQERLVARLLDSSVMRAKLRRIHPAAEQYLRLSLEGYSDVEILGNPGKGVPSMLDHPLNAEGGALTPTAWDKYKKLIFQALKSGYQEAIAV